MSESSRERNRSQRVLFLKLKETYTFVSQVPFRSFRNYRMVYKVSDEMLGTFVPVLVYWVYSGLYMLLGSFDKYRLHSRKEEETKNFPSKGTVVRGVLVQQAFQIAVAIILFTVKQYYHTSESNAKN